MKTCHICLLGIIVLMLASAPATAEIITLKDGTIIKGSILSMDEIQVVVRSSELGLVTVKRRTVKSINDGVAATPEPLNNEMPTAPVNLAESKSVNVNINNNHQITTDQKQTNTPVNMDSSVNRFVPKAMTGAYGSFNIGMASTRFDGVISGDHRPLYHWDVLGFQRARGIGMTLFLETKTHKSHRNISYRGFAEEKTKWNHGGLRFDYSFADRDPANGPYLGVSIGVIGLAHQSPVFIGGFDLAGNHQEFDLENREFQSYTAGLTLGYRARINDDFGIHLAFNGMNAHLTEVGGATLACSPWGAMSNSSCSKETVNMTNLSGMVGLGYTL